MSSIISSEEVNVLVFLLFTKKVPRHMQAQPISHNTAATDRSSEWYWLSLQFFALVVNPVSWCSCSVLCTIKNPSKHCFRSKTLFWQQLSPLTSMDQHVQYSSIRFGSFWGLVLNLSSFSHSLGHYWFVFFWCDMDHLWHIMSKINGLDYK